MLDVSLTQVSNPYTAQLAEIERRRKMAELLQQQGMQPLGGTETVPGGWAVQRSPLEGIGKMAQALSGAYGQKMAGDQAKDVSKQYQTDLSDTLTRAMRAGSGTRAASPTFPNDDEGNPMPSVDAQAPDHALMAQILMQHPGTAPLGQQQLMQDMSRKSLIAALSCQGQPQTHSTAGQSSAPAQQGAPSAGGPAGGIPMAAWLEVDPTGKSYMEQLAKDNAPINMRPGGTAYIPGKGPMFTAPNGANQVTWQNGQPSMGTIPGALPAMAAQSAATAGGSAAGAAPYQVDTVNTQGAPTAMTRQQQIEAVTGRPMPQPGQPPAPPAQAAPTQGGQPQPIPTEALLGAAPRVPGLPLQDASQTAAQRELGQGIGKEATQVLSQGANAVHANRELQNASSLATNFTPDRLQPLKASFGTLMNAFGMPENTINSMLGTNVGDIRALTSAAVKMAGTLTRQTDAQPSQIQFLKNLESMPQSDMTEQGFQKVIAYMKDLNDFKIEKMVNLQKWLNTHQGDPSGFEAAWVRQAAQIKPFGSDAIVPAAGPRSVTPQSAPATLTPSEQEELKKLRQRFSR